MQFRWIDWNLDHIAEHGVSAEEAEMVVKSAKKPFPRKIGDEKWIVVGRGRGGRFLQVIYLTDPDKIAFVIHARPINDREKRRLLRKWKP